MDASSTASSGSENQKLLCSRAQLPHTRPYRHPHDLARPEQQDQGDGREPAHHGPRGPGDLRADRPRRGLRDLTARLLAQRVHRDVVVDEDLRQLLAVVEVAEEPRLPGLRVADVHLQIDDLTLVDHEVRVRACCP